MTNAIVAEIRQAYVAGASPAELAARYGAGRSTVHWVLSGRSWSHLPMPRGIQSRERWVRLAPVKHPRAGCSVRLFAGGRAQTRSVELLYRAAWEPETLMPLLLARVGPRAAPRPLEVIPVTSRPPLKPMPTAPVEPPIAAAEVPELADQAAARTSHKGDSTTSALPELDDDDDDRPRRNGRARLDEENVLEARRLHSEGWGIQALAARYGVGRVTIHYALVGKTWRHVPMV